MNIIIGSARHDENNRYVRGKPGDQLQGKSPDFSGEVSMQSFYVAKKGWNVIRAKDPAISLKIAANMKAACNNANLGYSQSDRYGVISNGIKSKKPTNCDCSSLVRACVKEATGKDPGDFTTVNAAAKLEATGLFEKAMPYTASVKLYTGNILCTKIKGHIVIVTDGNQPVGVANPIGEYYPQYTGTTLSIVTALNAIGVDSSMANRRKIAAVNNIINYQGSMNQNLELIALLKQGKLRRQ